MNRAAIGDMLLKWWPVIAAVLGGLLAFKSLEERVLTLETRLTKTEADIATLDEKLTKLKDEDLKEIRQAMGAIQLDVGQLCAAQFGAEACYTSGRRTR